MHSTGNHAFAIFIRAHRRRAGQVEAAFAAVLVHALSMRGNDSALHALWMELKRRMTESTAH
jgi:hypothetical protein